MFASSNNILKKIYMKLYSYFRSSASYRVRIALNLKGLSYDVLPVHLVKNGGEQNSADYRSLNPEGLVPALAISDHDAVLTQSLAILEYLEETHPRPALLPIQAADRAYVRSLALAIACEIHPLNNLRVLRYLSKEFAVSEDQKNAWYKHWVESGLATMDAKLAQEPRRGKFCFGDTPGYADCVLIPQIFNAQRFQCDVSKMPILMEIYQNCMALPAFINASPAQQVDAE
jgi:maleylpyruvate isomerase